MSKCKFCGEFFKFEHGSINKSKHGQGVCVGAEMWRSFTPEELAEQKRIAEEEAAKRPKRIPQVPNKEYLMQWAELYKPPFVFIPEGTTLFDDEGKMVLQIRGWGNISSQLGDEEGAKIQDAFGHKVAELLNTWYYSPTIQQQLSQPL